MLEIIDTPWLIYWMNEELISRVGVFLSCYLFRGGGVNTVQNPSAASFCYIHVHITRVSPKLPHNLFSVIFTLNAHTIEIT